MLRSYLILSLMLISTEYFDIVNYTQDIFPLAFFIPELILKNTAKH
jgi:hypothetical protein